MTLPSTPPPSFSPPTEEVPATRDGYVLDARPDTLDFRDRMYEPTLVEVPPRTDLDHYRQHHVPVLDQGSEGACTGFGLATVANFLLRGRVVDPDETAVSPWMLYDLARRYDEWPGEDYSGSSARGAVKGWHKHGVCCEDLWPLPDRRLAAEHLEDGMRRPLGAYLRVNHQDLVAMHGALTEVGVLFATSRVHAGWQDPPSDGRIIPSDEQLGAHAFAVVGYDTAGFWIQNSWGDDWGAGGLGHVSYDDWLASATDVWVTRLGVPVALHDAGVAEASAGRAQLPRAYTQPMLRSHVVSLGNEGRLRPGGSFGTTAADVDTLFTETIPTATSSWSTKRLVLYAHGGLVSESGAVQRIAEYRDPFLAAEAYPLALVWRTDVWSTITNVLEDALGRRRPEGFLDAAKDFMLDRLDDALEPLARAALGRTVWREMTENALAASRASTTPGGEDGGARILADRIAAWLDEEEDAEVHLVAHSAGSILHAPLVEYLTTEHDVTISSCTLWAPACTLELFDRTYRPAVEDGRIGRFAVYALTDEAEQDDHCANIYHKSLLYLVSNALGDEPRIPLTRPGEPLLGMQRFLHGAELPPAVDVVYAPTEHATGPTASRARGHADFDDDTATVQGTLGRILDEDAADVVLSFWRSASSLSDARQRLQQHVTPRRAI